MASKEAAWEGLGNSPLHTCGEREAVGRQFTTTGVGAGWVELRACCGGRVINHTSCMHSMRGGQQLLVRLASLPLHTCRGRGVEEAVGDTRGVQAGGVQV